MPTPREIRFTLTAEEIEQCKPWTDFGTDLNEVVHDVFRRYLQDYYKDFEKPQNYGFRSTYDESYNPEGKL